MPPIRILWQSFVDATQNKPYLDQLGVFLNKAAAPGTQVDVVGLSPPDRDFGRLTEFRCAALAIDRCIEAEEQGYDCFVMGHFQDPGLYEARSAVRIPVVGAGESTLHFAAQLGRRIALVSIDPVFDVYHREQADRYGLGDRVTEIAGLGLVPEDFKAAFDGDQAAFDRLLKDFVAMATPLVDRGADVIVPAGVLPGLLLGQVHGAKVRHAPVVSCAAVGLKAAEMWIALFRQNGIEPSRGPSFALAPQRARDDFRAMVAGEVRPRT
jgi:Asp/Glu/hydantoin racemase